ncbi:hypothetical protein AB0J82_23050 [Asanoa sp. NPDC049518]|uniref:hypothetical protein n=1 Tax=unclassified Asanoa TaxID=2685164 RepID=UPI003422DB99
MIDRSDTHHYQPGYLFLPFGSYDEGDIVRPRDRFIPRGVHLDYGDVERVDPDANVVSLASGRTFPYDYLVIATGVEPRPDQTPGLLDGGEWCHSIHVAGLPKPHGCV